MGYLTMGMENQLTIILAIVGFIVVLMAQVKINSAYKKYKEVRSKKGLSGFEVARKILDENNMGNIHVVEVKGKLSDHYDPRRKVVRLSTEVFHGDSIASVSVAAHEVGHAIQDKDNYIWMNIRGALVPIVNFMNYLGYFALIISIFAGITSYIILGVLLILATLLFQLITLPVEFDASKRANAELLKVGIIDEEEVVYSKKMLDAAAMTYVAGIISSLISLMRLLIMLNGDD